MVLVEGALTLTLNTPVVRTMREKEKGCCFGPLCFNFITINWKQVPIGKRERRTGGDNQRP